jgi:hypothetical protein
MTVSNKSHQGRNRKKRGIDGMEGKLNENTIITFLPVHYFANNT